MFQVKLDENKSDDVCDILEQVIKDIDSGIKKGYCYGISGEKIGSWKLDNVSSGDKSHLIYGN